MMLSRRSHYYGTASTPYGDWVTLRLYQRLVVAVNPPMDWRLQSGAIRMHSVNPNWESSSTWEYPSEAYQVVPRRLTLVT